MTSKKACFVVNQYEFLKLYTKRKVPEIQGFQGLSGGCPVGFEPTTFRTTI